MITDILTNNVLFFATMVAIIGVSSVTLLSDTYLSDEPTVKKRSTKIILTLLAIGCIVTSVYFGTLF